MQQPSLQDCKAMSSYIESSNSFYQDLLGYIPGQTSLQQIPENKWNEFAQARRLNSNSSGIYLPRNQTAVIQEEDTLSLFHEYFGHGLYCEQSLQGRKLVKLERKLLEKEKDNFQGRQFTLENLQKFRQQNQTFQELDKFRKQNLAQYELFAIWTEYLLSGEFNLKDEFEMKYDSFLREEKEAVDSVVNFSQKYGNLATFYAQGMARRMTAERVRGLFTDLCRQKLGSIKFGVLFGSKEEFSDMDLYLVSDEIEPFHADWIDVRVHTPRRFEEGTRNFDVRVTDPLFSGKFVFGNRNYLEQQKQILREQQITEEAIKYNLQKSEDYRSLSKDFFELCDQVENPLSYAATYLANALALRQGLRLFAKEELFSYSLEEKQIQMKGGARK